MDQEFILFSAKTLGEYHYLKNEIEAFYLNLNVMPIFQNHKSSTQIVAYTMAIQEWHKSKCGTKENLIAILNLMSWTLVASKIENYNKSSNKSGTDPVNQNSPNVKSENSKLISKTDMLLIEAVRSGNIRKVTKLTANGNDPVNVDVIIEESSESPLLIAIQEENLDIIKCLIEADCNVNLIANKNNRLTPLHLAVERGNYDIVETLRTNGANVNAKDVREWTPLHIAVEYGNRRIYEYLMAERANFESKTELKYTPLHLACKGWSLEIVSSLCNYGADKEAAAEKGMRPVHLAAQNGRLEILEYLINQGCAFDTLNEEGLSPYFLAKLKNHSHVTEYLLNLGPTLR